MSAEAPSASSPSSTPRRPTIRDVARLAGVSHSTVSRYLNGGKWVGSTSMRAIVAAIDATGYRANGHARALSTGRSSTMAFVISEPQRRLFGDPNYAVLLESVTAALGARGLLCVLMTAHTDTERDQVLDFAAAGHVGGVMVLSSHADDPLLARLIAAGVPTVSCGRPLGLEHALSVVAADDCDGARQAVTHLSTLGRTRIATITGPLDVGGGVDRWEGYVKAMENAGLPLERDLVAHGDWSHVSGRKATVELLGSPRPFDALFAASDDMAAGALVELRRAGVRVPEDVAVVGFDDAGLASTVDPPLSSMRQPFDQIGRELVRLLCDQGPTAPPVSIRIPTRLIVRSSSRGDLDLSSPYPAITER